MPRWHGLPQGVYRLVEQSAGSVLLESADQAGAENSIKSPPQSRLFLTPVRQILANKPADLPALFSEIERAVGAGLHAAGYFSYECADFFEPSAQTLPAQGDAPLAWFGIYEHAHVFDHSQGEFLDGDPAELHHLSSGEGDDAESEPQVDCSFSSTEDEYAERIARIHELIRAGDVYQLNFTMPMSLRADGSAAHLYARLRSRQPAPYGAFLHTRPGRRILSFSPELFFRIDSTPRLEPSVPRSAASSAAGREASAPRRITTQPMKGTAPRGRTTVEDTANAAWLTADPKNRAENVMIVDLVRNDLGRLCSFGSVRVSGLFAVERYPTLWQMTSTVSGELRAEVGFEDVFRALFPSGSVTGAPKVRAMQCIAGLEQQPRGVYTGAIGYFSKEQTVFNVAIRTLTLREEGTTQAGTMGVGGGIVIDSTADAEWQECQLKAQFLTGRFGLDRKPSRAAPGFSLIETMLWHSGYPLIDLHLDRLEDSASYFAFPFNRAEARVALESHAAAFLLYQPLSNRAPFPRFSSGARAGDHELQPAAQPRKVRLLLDSTGGLTITSEPIPPSSGNPLRIHISAQRTNSRDPFYFHKTTHRPLYAKAHQQAADAGFDDAIFLNERSEVTEGAIHNLFIEQGGKLLTPPVASGLLAGVHRSHILATEASAQERVLTLEDLRQADAVYLSNAVCGLRRAVIDWESLTAAGRCAARTAP